MSTPTTPMLTPPRVVRPLRNLDLEAIKTVAEQEQLPLADTVRLLLSFGTFKWTAGYRSGELGIDSHSVKLLPGGIEAVKSLAEREGLAWDAMASHILAFALANWQPGWRKDSPGPLGPGGLNKHTNPAWR